MTIENGLHYKVGMPIAKLLPKLINTITGTLQTTYLQSQTNKYIINTLLWTV